MVCFNFRYLIFNVIGLDTYVERLEYTNHDGFHLYTLTKVYNEDEIDLTKIFFSVYDMDVNSVFQLNLSDFTHVFAGKCFSYSGSKSWFRVLCYDTFIYKLFTHCCVETLTTVRGTAHRPYGIYSVLIDIMRDFRHLEYRINRKNVLYLTGRDSPELRVFLKSRDDIIAVKSLFTRFKLLNYNIV